MTVSHYYLPASVPEALGLLAEHGPELLVMAGGTVAMPLINEGISLPGRVMGLRRAGLDRLERVDAELHIGATTTLTRLVEQDDVPLLRRAASRTASWSIRNMGTVGGNLFTPPPGGDVAAALLALDARVVVTGPAGPRTLPLADLWTGFLTTCLAADELVTSIVVPLDAGPDGVRQVRAQGGQHAVRRHGRSPRDDGRGDRDGGPDRARGRRAVSDAHDASGGRDHRLAPGRGRHRGRGGRGDRGLRPDHRRHRERLVPTEDGRRVHAARARGAGASRPQERRRSVASVIVSFELSGREVEVMVAPMTTLQAALRDQLGHIVGQGGLSPGRLRLLHGARGR